MLTWLLDFIRFINVPNANKQIPTVVAQQSMCADTPPPPKKT